MMYFFSPSSQGYLVARWSARKECGCPTPLCILNTMHRHYVTCRTPSTLPFPMSYALCPTTNALNGFVFASLFPSRFLCQWARDTNNIQLSSECIITTINLQYLPKKCEVDHFTLGSSSIPLVTVFWDTL